MSSIDFAMETTTECECPWCGQPNVVTIDTSQGSHRMVTDCEVCCRPIQIGVDCEPGEILGLDVAAG